MAARWRTLAGAECQAQAGFLPPSGGIRRDPGGSSRNGTASLRREPRVCSRSHTGREDHMAESVYKVIELIGTSTESWDATGRAVVERAAQTLRDLRVAEVIEQDIQITDGKVEAYRAKLKVSFKYEKETD